MIHAFRHGRLALFALTLAMGGCSSPSLGPQIGYTLNEAHEAPAPKKEEKRRAPEVPADIVERSRLPFSGFRAADGVRLERAELFDDLSRFDAVCVGELHDNPHHHYAQLAVVEGLWPRARHAGRALGIGFEMFQRPFQRALNRYADGTIDEAELLEETEWEERWGHPFAYYRPLVQLARTAGLRLVALNAPRELTRKVAREGLSSLDAKERSTLPVLDFGNAEHRKAFDAAMADHPKGQGDLENYYAAQVLWDETMAQTAAGWLQERAPARQLVIVAGRAHCQNSAIPSRIERRGDFRVASVVPWMPSEGEPDPRSADYDYALVFEKPDAVASR